MNSKIVIAFFAMAMVSCALACVYDSECGSTGRCLNRLCVGSSPVTNRPVTIIVPGCTYDSQCGVTGRCVSGRCLQTAECTRHLDCLSRGLYYECSTR